METQRRGTQPSQWGGLRGCPEVVGTPVYLGQTRREIPDSNNSDITVVHSVRETSEMTKWGHRRVAVPTPANVRHWPEEKLFSVELSPVRVQKRRIRLISKCKAGPLLLAPAFLPSSVLRQAYLGGRGLCICCPLGLKCSLPR